MKAIVFCDIDGCLSEGKNSVFDLPTLAQIKDMIPRLAAKDIGLTLCTGRPQPYAEAMSQLLGTDMPFVCEGGSMVYEPVGDVYRPMVDADSMRAIAELQRVIQHSDLLSDDLYFELGNAFSMCLTGPAFADFGQNDMRAEMERLISLYADYPVSWSHSVKAIDITVKGVDKGTGVRAICADYNIALAQTAGIGDSNGDVGMFKVVARGYCPRNASDELKSMASYVSSESYMAGTLNILQAIEKNPVFL